MEAIIEFPKMFASSTKESFGASTNGDSALIEAAKKGSDDAFRRLIERHQNAIYQFCFRWLRDSEDAREACQDTFVRAHRSLRRYRESGHFSTWLYRIALNVCRDRHKSKSNRQRRETTSLTHFAGEVAASQPAPDEVVARANDLEKLHHGIQQLPEKLRVVMIICGIEGMSQEDCAGILDCSVRAVEGRLYRARQQLLVWWNQEEN
ncbi:MAG: sigma-70 family RNA polymerase sigma factor [Verrucomicrobiota bacterium]